MPATLPVRRTFAALVASLLVPTAIPLAGIGPLVECGHCVRSYLAMFPIAPFVSLAALSGLRGSTSLVAAAVGLAAWLCAAWIVARRARRPVVIAFAATTCVMAAVGAFGTAALLRM